jgi:hypothetical protein
VSVVVTGKPATAIGEGIVQVGGMAPGNCPVLIAQLIVTCPV